MARASRQEWSERIERWAESGLTAQEFAAQIGVKPRTLIHWKWFLKSGAKGKAMPRPGPDALSFVELARSATEAGGFEVELGNGTRVRVPSGFDADTLRRLLEVLGRRS